MKKKVCNCRLFIFLGVFLLLSGLYLFSGEYEKVEAAESLPRIAIVGLEHSPFVEGDENEFYISSKNFSGEVQYQLFYTSKELMGDKWALIENEDMVNGWTKPSNANEAVKVKLTKLNLKPSYYRFAIRVRRVGYKGKYENSYGDYDNAYPFMITVKEKADINLNGNMITDKTEYENYEKLIIDGVEGAEEDTEYKLHIYDIKNSRWLGNLTEYSSKTEYNLQTLKPGKYLVDIWGRRSDSINKYDGWKLKIIEVKEEQLPKVAIVGLEHSPFVVGDENEFYISSKNFDGEVQYQLFYTNKEQMGDKWEIINDQYMIDGWTAPAKYNKPVKVDLTNLNLKAGYYRFAIRVRRVGYKGKYQNSYGDYDNAYPFMITVMDSSNTTLNGDMITNKIEFKKNDNLVIEGVESETKDTQYKLHLYDVDNNKWLTNLTEYSEKVEYDLSNVPEGTYLVDIWSRESNSSRKYDGWKLKLINVTTEINEVINVDDIEEFAWMNTDHKLPKRIPVNMEDGSIQNKFVQWDSQPNTAVEGTFSYEGSVLGYDKKVKASVNVKNGTGNTSGNIINMGLVAEKDNWIYYHNISDEGKLYKYNKDTEEIVKMIDYTALYINVVDEWIYYANFSENGHGTIYKLKTDGSLISMLNYDVSEQVTVKNGWIYYANASDEYKLYKINLNGGQRTKLNDDTSLNLNVDGEYVYYTNISDNNKPYKIKIDGTDRTKLGEDEAAFINVYDGYIYYANKTENYKIYKMKTDGTENIKVSDDSALYLNINDGYIYYYNVTYLNGIYKMRIDGTDNSRMTTMESVNIQVAGDNFYYLDGEDDYRLYTGLTDGYNEIVFGVEIKNIKDLETTIAMNHYYSLPTSVEVEMMDGITRKRWVTWEEGSEVDTKVPGIYNIEGTVKGYSEKIKLKVTVLGIDQFKGVIEKTVSLFDTSRVNLSYISYVPVILENGDEKLYSGLTWNPTEIEFDKPGVYTAEGTIEGFDGKQIIKFNVIEIDHFVDDSFELTIPRGGSAGLPKKLKVIMSDGSEREVEIAWEYENLDINKPGEYIINGYPINSYRVIAYDHKATYKVNVVENDNTVSGEVIYIDGDWVYYKNIYDEKKIYKIREDGSGRARVSDKEIIIYEIKDGCIYFAYGSAPNIGVSKSLYKMTTDGKDIIKLNDDYTFWDYQFSGEWIYYINPDDRISKMKTDGTEKTLLGDGDVREMKIDDGWIYFINDEYNRHLYKIRIDGTGKTELVNKDTIYLKVKGDFVYYEVRDALYMARKDGTEQKELTGGYKKEIIEYHLVGDWVYVIQRNYNDYDLLKVKVDGSEKQLLLSRMNSEPKHLSIYGEWINYQFGEYIYKLKTDGTINELIVEERVEVINMMDGWIYYKKIFGNLIYKIRVDGTENQIVM
ncbi:DUF5050 domain-containing protein [Oceanirhabdus sp. W0125-5]|uniref:DUF5050 domain-containing protein n=1 Tax=Oceanirhabdus sp. W0125-5 TaxID=2999116 RepID=UPI0022F2F4DB|nr:DUF5050 domain-containing protein [Oceanirhabdus sp. W0125-5]WBW99118.1 DUF5050 domain-containing protein [Oceanirhabdus sp. W0125-5]